MSEETTERAKFEEWQRAVMKRPIWFLDRHEQGLCAGEYRIDRTEQEWCAWQARAALSPPPDDQKPDDATILTIALDAGFTPTDEFDDDELLSFARSLLSHSKTWKTPWTIDDRSRSSYGDYSGGGLSDGSGRCFTCGEPCTECARTKWNHERPTT